MRVEPLVHESRRALAQWLATYRLHRIHLLDIDGDKFVVKLRRVSSPLAIVIGNLYLQWQGSDSTVLSRRQWLQWECELARSTMRTVVSPELAMRLAGPCGWVSHFVPGLVLSNLLKDTRWTQPQKLVAIGLALKTLVELHHLTADWGNGIRLSISHGDATVNNAIVDWDNQKVHWIDFDMRHRTRLSELDRQADDVRALICSSAARLPQASFHNFSEVFEEAGLAPRVICRLQERFESSWRRPSTFHLAQAALSWHNNQALIEALQSARYQPLAVSSG